MKTLSVLLKEFNGRGMDEKQLACEFEKIARSAIYGGHFRVNDDFDIYIREIEFFFIPKMNLRVAFMIGRCIIEEQMSIISPLVLYTLIVQELMSHLSEEGLIAPVSLLGNTRLERTSSSHRLICVKT